MTVRAAAVLISSLALGGSLLGTPALTNVDSVAGRASSAAAATASTSRPHAFVKVTSRPGPGSVTISWQHDGVATTSYVLETALTQFSRTSSTLPAHGRHAKTFTVSAKARSITLSAAQLAAAGAPVGSGNHLFFRLAARNAKGTGSASERAYPYIGAVAPDAVPARAATRLRVASYNVRTSRATADVRSWMQRRVDVAGEILARAPEVETLQELGPGRADGKAGSLHGTMRQTDSLLQSLAAQGGRRYKLVRSTPYAEPGTPSGTQGMRLLYDSSKAQLVSTCSETTGKHAYSSSCSFKLPLLSGDSESLRRRAVYAEFRDRASGKRFFVVSTHLDTRHSSSAATEKTYNALRARQAKTIVTTVAKINTAHRPLVVGGDMNSWQNIQVGNGPHDTFVASGFADTAAAPSRVNVQYSTFNDFAKVQRPYDYGYGSRLDLIASTGFAGTTRFENVTRATDAQRPSDHNMIVADMLL